MDFRSRGGQPASPAASSSSSTFNTNANSVSKWLERSSVILLFSIAIIILAIAGLAFFGGNSEAKAIKKDNFQAIFLNNGQVYFGHIKDLNNKFVNLQTIYYLQTNNTDSTQTTAAANNNVQLVKLGCELHAPFDQMVINRDQVLFWENLKDDSQVVKAIAQYKKDNPNGQTCSSSSQNSTQQAPTGSTQSNTSTQPSTSTPTTKKP